jgi:peptidoglycan/xylan/chitin deacetylase (PgdA/CDA1 family)
MLTFKRTNIFMFACLFVLNISHLFPHIYISGWWYLALGIVYMVIINIGSFRVDSNFHFHVICKGNSSVIGAAITFDDGPNPETTPQVLDVLKKHNVKAAFFLIGKKAESHPELVKRIIAEGHVIGNHTYGHSHYFDFFTPRIMAREFKKSYEIIKGLTGLSIHWFRPPYGVTNPMMKKALKMSEFVPVGWSVRSLDTVIRNQEKILRRLEKTGNGDIVLLHDIRKDMPDILEKFIMILENKKIKITDPETVLGISAYKNQETK